MNLLSADLAHPRNQPIQGEDGARGGTVPLLVRVWGIILRRKWLIAAIMAVVLGAALVLTVLATPLYTSTATLEISREGNRVVTVEGVEPRTDTMDLEFYQTQYLLLAARSLADRVVSELGLARNDTFFELFDVDVEEIIAQEGGGRNPREIRNEVAAQTLLDHVSVSPVRASRLVNVSFTSPDREFSARVANIWVREFIGANLERRYEATTYAREFLEDQLEQTREKLEASERQLVAYAAQQGIISVSGSEGGAPDATRQERPLLASELAALASELNDATADRISAQSRLRGGAAATAEALSNDAISVLRGRRAEAAAELADLMTKFEPNYPPAQAVQSRIAELDRAIDREERRVSQYIQQNYQQARARESALSSRVSGLKDELLDLRRRSIQYNIYQRDVDTNRELYLGLLQRYKEVGVSAGVGVNNIVIVDAALVPRLPSSPNLLVNLLLGIILGAVLAGLVVVVLEQVDETLLDPNVMHERLGLPSLGVIPRLEESDDPMTQVFDSKSVLSEAYLSVQQGLKLATDHGFPKTIGFTSTRPGEGKSTTSTALAVRLARTGRSVVLVDGDMRSPSINKMLGLENKRGLSNYLAGDDDLQSMFIATQVPSMSVITAGPTPPNAAELLSNARLQQFLAELTRRFDHVIVDAPPVLGLADAPIFAQHLEATVMIIEAGATRASAARRAIERLSSAEVNLAGAIMTKFEAKRATFGYGYDYGYGYGSDEERTA